MEIHPCVLQDIGPLGPLPCSHTTSSAITLSRASGTADHVQSLDDLFTYWAFMDGFCINAPTQMQMSFYQCTFPLAQNLGTVSRDLFFCFLPIQY